MRITRVTTKTGDGGLTRLADGTRVPKDSERVAAFGTIDELNSVLGVVLATGVEERVAGILRRVQNELFELGGGLSFPDGAQGAGVTDDDVALLESDQDELLRSLDPLENFVLPGGTLQSAQLHLARTVCRRAERDVVRLARSATVSPTSIAYLNRLSDALFIMARYENKRAGHQEPMWDQRGRARR